MTIKAGVIRMSENNDFVAIDFETATGTRSSSCAVGIVTVCAGQIVEKYHSLIRPPENHYWRQNIEIHGITPAATRSAPDFYKVYPEIRSRLSGKLVVAHNESFDRSVLKASMAYYGLDYEELGLSPRWECTMKIYRARNFPSARLDCCCEHMNIPLNHHDALSDALACAMLYIAR